eukprot:g7051.t1
MATLSDQIFVKTKSEATNHQIPTDQSGYDAEFLSKAIDLPVKSFELQTFGDEGAGGGFAGGIVCRLNNIEYKDHQSKCDRPKTLILKWLNMANGPTNGGSPNVGFLERLILFSVCKMEMNTEEVQRREYDFFSGKSMLHDKIRNAGIKLPDCYACDMLDYGNPNHCCMVWCNKKTKMRRYMLFGDITNEMAIKYKVTSTNMMEKHIGIATTTMAKIHAVNWKYNKNDKMLSEQIQSTYWYDCVFGRTPVLNKMKNKYTFKKYFDEWGCERTYLSDEKISKPLIELEVLYANKISKIIENLNNKQTILHGDYHFGNIMFLKDVDDVIILDWQMYGYGHVMYEFVYFVFGTLANEKYIDRTRAFNYLKLYYDELIKLNPGIAIDMTWEETQKIFVCVLFELYVWVIGTYRAIVKKRKVRDQENKRDTRFIEVNEVLGLRDEHITLFVADLMNHLNDYGL